MRESQRRLTSEESVRPRSTSGRRARVQLLDGEFLTIEIDRKARGGDLLDRVCEELDLEEKDYFGLLHQLRGDPRVWVDLNKRLSKTFRNEPWEVSLAVKFYPPEPSELRDDITRYQLTLAVRKDLAEGRLACSLVTQALLLSYELQAEKGDRCSRVPPTAIPADHADLIDKVDELYKKHRGQTPAEAELNYLENAKKLSLYGAEIHSVQDSEGVDLQLAVSSNGISVYRDGVMMNRFPWAKISKICYKKREFSLKFRLSEFEDHRTVLVFKLQSPRAARQLWHCSVDQHVFFRRESPVQVSRVPFLPLLGRQTSCRRTLRQLRDNNTAIAV